MDALGSVMQGFQFGQGLREVKTKRKLADLYSQAYTAPREKRGGLIGQMIGLDPEAGMRAHDMGNKMDDRTMQEVVRAAKTLAVLPPEQQGAFYQANLPKFREMGVNLPDQFDDTVRDSVSKIAQAWGDPTGQNKVQSRWVAEDGTVYHSMADGSTASTGIKADRQMWFRDHPGMAPELVGKDGVVRPVGTAPQGAMIGGDGTPVFIDPSIPPEVRAQILQGEQIAQAPTQRAWTQNTPDMVRGAAPRPSEAQVAAERAAAEARVRAAYEPGIAAATEGAKTNARLGVEMGYAQQVSAAEADKAGAIEGAKAEATRAAEARARLPKVISTADDTLAVVEKALNHPGRAVATGGSMYDPRNYLPGTPQRDFGVILEQLKGKTFLQAFESLKGAGAITEQEGKAATDAFARLNRAQSDGAFVEALQELQTLLMRAKVKAQRDALGAAARPGGGQAVRRARNPKTGEVLELRNGQWVPAR